MINSNAIYLLLLDTNFDSCVLDGIVIIDTASLTTGGSTSSIDSQRIRNAPLAPEGTRTRRIRHDARRPPS